MSKFLAAQPGLPILYSFRRCPYAIRARLAIQASGVQVELREILLRDKPPEMVQISPKATVPVLQLPSGEVIDESRQIIDWALDQHDPNNWALADQPLLYQQAQQLIDRNDGEFKALLDRYKYAVRFPEQPAEHYRDQAMLILSRLDLQLGDAGFLLDDRQTLADVALYPFVRQFAFVDKVWFDQQPLPALQGWLQRFLTSEWFASVMVKLPLWKEAQGDQEGKAGVVFPIQSVQSS